MAFDSEFWEEEEAALTAALAPGLYEILVASGQFTVDTLLEDFGVGVDWALVNKSAQEWLRTYGASLISGITDTTRDVVRDIINDWIASGEPLKVLAKSLEPIFGPIRARMIAVTETTRAYAEGNIIAWKQSGVVLGMKWHTSRNESVCPICAPLEGKTSQIYGGGFGDGGLGIPSPPAHVNCLCWLTPIVRPEDL